MTKTIRTILATGLLSSGLFCQQAQATTIDGTIKFSGTLTAQILGTGIDGINWNPPMNAVSYRDEDYSSVPIGTLATFTNFQWDSSTLAITTPATTPFVEWTFTIGSTTYDFILDNPLLPGTGITHTKWLRTNVWSVNVLGTGTAQITGFEDTVGVFSVSGTGNAAHLMFDASGIASDPPSGDSVPDGGPAVALLGIALAGLEILRRKRRGA